MRDEEFRQKLTEVAEWEIPVTMERTEQGGLKRRRAIQQAGQDCYNPTFPPKLKKLKHRETACEDCGKICRGRRKDMRLYENNGYRLFKEKCLECGLHKDPYTGEFKLDGCEASRKFIDYTRYKAHYKNKV